jgi:thiamine biosynthesis protein ThiS
MRITYNHEVIELEKQLTLKALIEMQEDITHKAVWLNNAHVPLREFENILIKDGDHVKVIRIRGGG